MTTTIRSRMQGTLRSIFMVPAYTIAFALPVATLILTFIGMHAYCASASGILDTPAMCVGLAQWQESLPEAPQLQLPALPALGGF